MIKHIVKCEGLTKLYKINLKHSQNFKGFIKAVDEVSFSVNKGEIFGLLGPNGAGKTTILKILSTMIRPTKGKALIDGLDILKETKEVRYKVGLVLGTASLYHRMKAYDNLVYYARIYDVKGYKERIKELAEEFGLKEWLHTYVENYSSGMKMKLALMRALLHDPEVLLLDEPTAGLDPVFSWQFRKMLRSLNKTIVMATHLIYEAEYLCDNIGFMNRGRLIKVGHLREFVKDEENRAFQIKAKNPEELYLEIKNNPYIIDTEVEEDKINVKVKANKVGELLKILSEYESVYIKEKTDLNNIFKKTDKR